MGKGGGDNIGEVRGHFEFERGGSRILPFYFRDVDLHASRGRFELPFLALRTVDSQPSVYLINKKL